MSTLRLRTDRLELRPLPARTAAALPADRDEVGRALGAQLDAQWPDPSLQNVLLRQAGMPPGTEHFGVWVMIERDGERVVGDVGFHGPPDRSGTIEIGYSVVACRRRRGYATEAASALVAWVLTQPGVHVVVAGCDPANTASVRTLERVGFGRTGVVSGQIRWRYEHMVDRA